VTSSLPYKPKRKTRALLAREKGLEPLARIIMKQEEANIYNRANSFIKNPIDVVRLQQHVRIKVMDIDIDRKRISLSMKDLT